MQWKREWNHRHGKGRLGDGTVSGKAHARDPGASPAQSLSTGFKLSSRPSKQKGRHATYAPMSWLQSTIFALLATTLNEIMSLRGLQGKDDRATENILKILQNKRLRILAMFLYPASWDCLYPVMEQSAGLFLYPKTGSCTQTRIIHLLSKLQLKKKK